MWETQIQRIVNGLNDTITIGIKTKELYWYCTHLYTLMYIFKRFWCQIGKITFKKSCSLRTIFILPLLYTVSNVPGKFGFGDISLWNWLTERFSKKLHKLIKYNEAIHLVRQFQKIMSFWKIYEIMISLLTIVFLYASDTTQECK